MHTIFKSVCDYKKTVTVFLERDMMLSVASISEPETSENALDSG